MAYIILPSKWTQQPQYPVEIDLGHPLALDVISIQDARGFDYVTGQGTLANNDPINTVYTERGEGRSFGTNSLSFPIATNTGDPYGGSLLYLGTQQTASWATGSENNGMGLACAGDLFGIGHISSMTGANDGSTRWQGIGVIVGVCYGQYANSGIWVNGVGSLSESRNTQLKVPANTSIMTKEPAQVGILSIRWKRRLDEQEVRDISENPWQVLKRRSRRIFVASAGGGTSYNVALDPNTYATADLNIAVKADRKANLASTSYIASDLNIAVKADRKAKLSPANYSISDLNIAVKADRKATLASTSYTVSDLNIAIKADRKATLASTSYNISSLPLELVYSSIVITGYSIVLNPNTYTASDLDIALKTTRKTTLASVNYSVSNVDTALKADRKTALSPVNYNITGLDNVFKASRGISLGTTSYSIVGFNSNYYTNRSVVLGPSIYITEGYPIVFPTYIPSYQPAHFIFSRPVAEVLTNVGVFGGVFEAQSRSTTISRPTENTQFLASSRDLIFIRN